MYIETCNQLSFDSNVVTVVICY